MTGESLQDVIIKTPDGAITMEAHGQITITSFDYSRLLRVLLWLLTAACIKTGRPQIARRAVELAELRLSKDNWPEYYDGKRGRLIGKQARRKQSWSIAGYIVSKLMLEDPSQVILVALEEDKTKTVLRRSNSWTLTSTIHQQYD